MQRELRQDEIEMKTSSNLRELRASELDDVSGGNALLLVLAGAVLNSLTGKVVEGVLEETGVTKQVLKVTNGKVSFLGRTVN